jgi:cytochrome c553
MRLGKLMQYRFCALTRTGAVLPFASVALVLAGGAQAETAAKGAVPNIELQAKIAYCENCHGVSARGFHGYYPIPRLAGQQTEYIKNQLEAFLEHRRTNNILLTCSARQCWTL